MTKQQKRMIENNFYNYQKLDKDNLWRVCFERTQVRSSFELTEQVFRLVFVEHRQRYNICRELKISKAGFYYHYTKIMDYAFLFAKSLKLI